MLYYSILYTYVHTYLHSYCDNHDNELHYCTALVHKYVHVCCVVCVNFYGTKIQILQVSPLISCIMYL